MGIALIGGGIALSLLIANASKKKKNQADDALFEDPEMELPAPSPDIALPPPVVSRPTWKGKYAKSVQINAMNTAGFNPSTFADKLISAVKTNNLPLIIQLGSKLNKDKIRMMHNAFLDRTRGKNTLYQFVLASDLPYVARKTIIEFLSNAGVGKSIKKFRNHL